MKAEDYILDYIESIEEEWEKAGMLNILERIKAMYLKEVSHIIKTKKSLLNLGPIKILKFVKKYNREEDFCNYENLNTEEEIAYFAIKTVNKIINNNLPKRSNLG